MILRKLYINYTIINTYILELHDIILKTNLNYLSMNSYDSLKLVFVNIKYLVIFHNKYILKDNTLN